MDDYIYMASILGRDIAGLEGEREGQVIRMYMIQCVEMLELKLEKYGGMKTLRVHYVAHRRDIDFVGTNYGAEPALKITAWPDPCPRCGGELLEGHTWLSSAHVCEFGLPPSPIRRPLV